MVLLDDEPRRLGLFAGDLGARFGGVLEITLGLVLGELFGHGSRLGHKVPVKAEAQNRIHIGQASAGSTGVLASICAFLFTPPGEV
jgi:hypothetical protein